MSNHDDIKRLLHKASPDDPESQLALLEALERAELVALEPPFAVLDRIQKGIVERVHPLLLGVGIKHTVSAAGTAFAIGWPGSVTMGFYMQEPLPEAHIFESIDLRAPASYWTWANVDALARTLSLSVGLRLEQRERDRRPAQIEVRGSDEMHHRSMTYQRNAMPLMQPPRCVSFASAPIWPVSIARMRLARDDHGVCVEGTIPVEDARAAGLLDGGASGLSIGARVVNGRGEQADEQ